ncbi:MAG: hypothetical protein WD824_21720 [Cyclobacteriaceae bacterium]
MSEMLAEVRKDKEYSLKSIIEVLTFHSARLYYRLWTMDYGLDNLLKQKQALQ